MTPIILLVEDNDDDAELTELAFRRAHVSNEIVRVSDGIEALEWLRREGSHAGRSAELAVAVILLDLNLPRMSGLAVLEAIRGDERLRHTPVVVLTSSDEEKDLLGAYEHHANSYVRKPIDHSGFVEAARHLGLYWLVLNLPPPASR